MTDKEFLDILTEQDFTPEEYSNKEGFVIPEEFEFSPEVVAIENEKTRLYGEFISHPVYNDISKRKDDPSYREASERWSNAPSAYDQQQKEFLDSIGIGMYEEIENEGGEGQGDSCYVVLYFKDVDKYIMADGSYASGEGKDWSYSSWSIVRPVQKTITVYE